MQISDLAPDFKQAIWSGSIKWHQCRRRDTKTYADAWRGAQESLLLSLNASYEGRYALAEPMRQLRRFPLTTDANGKQILTYRGVNVDPDPNDQKTMNTLKQPRKKVCILIWDLVLLSMTRPARSIRPALLIQACLVSMLPDMENSRRQQQKYGSPCRSGSPIPLEKNLRSG